MKLFRHLTALFCLASGTVFACDKPENRQFDFWIGEWQVTANGKTAGTNVISKHLGECALHEHYTTPTGYEGTSFNIYDKITRRWHQTWVDNTGLLLQLNGGLETLEDGRQAMVMWGEGMNPQGATVTHRITWTANEDGTVRQHWQMTEDQGLTWNSVFDGLYSKKAQ
ncbi:MAG: hypothetical protein ACFHVJ_02200 [Aestuariibacter sp.]